jgi:hypothetical protein
MSTTLKATDVATSATQNGFVTMTGKNGLLGYERKIRFTTVRTVLTALFGL